MGSEDYGFGWCSRVGKSASGLVLLSPGDRPTNPRPRKGILQSLSHRKLSSDRVREMKRVKAIDV
jgi:hypothetical protein